MVRMIVALLLLSGAVRADTLYRCVAKGGAVAYQDRPCVAQTTQTGTAEFTPEKVPVYNSPKVSRSSTPARTSKIRRAGAASGAYIPVEPTSTACEAAKARREKKLAQAGLKRTYSLLQRLDEDVRRVCR